MTETEMTETEMTETEMTETIVASAATELIPGALDSRDVAMFVRKKIAVHGSTHTKNARRRKTTTRTGSMSAPRDDSATALRNDSSSISPIARERRKMRKMLMTSLKLLLWMLSLDSM
jgi:hypothetical protein